MKAVSLNSCDWLCKQIAAQLCISPESVGPHSRLTGDLGIDSLEMQSLLLTIEDHFAVMPSAQQLHRVTTVDQLHALIVTLAEANGSVPDRVLTAT